MLNSYRLRSNMPPLADAHGSDRFASDKRIFVAAGTTV
jgi:hypothetical protein